MRRSPLVLGAAALTLAVTLGATGCSAGATGNASPGASAAARRSPTGTVTVKSGNKVVCVMTIKAGQGTCTVNTAKYPPGTLKFVGTYNGGGAFKSSAGSTTLRLNKAG